jgi:hypothetical protein
MKTKTLIRPGTVVEKRRNFLVASMLGVKKFLISPYVAVLTVIVVLLYLFGLSNAAINTISNEQYSAIISQLRDTKAVESNYTGPRFGRYNLLFFHVSPSILSYKAAVDYLQNQPLIDGLSTSELDVTTDSNWHIAYNYRLSTYPTWILLSKDGLFLHKWVGKIDMQQVAQVIQQKELWN